MKDYKEKLREIINSNSEYYLSEDKAVFAKYFPELQNDNDERIRQEIINFIWGYNDKLPERDRWLAWFEKQKNTSDKEYVFRPVAGDTIEKAAEQAVELDGKVVLAFNGAYIPVGNKNKDEIVAEYCNWVKKQGEQTTGKVKSRFKVGDWITNGNYTWEVVNITELDYVLRSQRGIVDDDISYVDKEFNLWTINDASDGDVLVTEDYIFIFKYILHGGVHLYCHYNFDDEEFDSDIPDAVIGNIHDKGIHFRPATKEQRDLLFRKIHDAGYEWNSEKKELSKQTLNITPKFCVGQLITDNDGTWYKITNIKCLEYYEVYDIGKDNTHLELCSIIDDRFV